MKRLRLIFTFYLSFALPAIILSLAAASAVFLYGLAALAISWYFKSITLAIIAFYFNTYYKKNYYYYQNLGVSKSFLWIGSITADIILYVFFIILAQQWYIY